MVRTHRNWKNFLASCRTDTTIVHVNSVLAVRRQRVRARDLYPVIVSQLELYSAVFRGCVPVLIFGEDGIREIGSD
jgi:hypothetical protein